MSRKPNDVIPEPSDAEWAVQSWNAICHRLNSGEDVPTHELDDVWNDLSEVDCESDRDAVALMAMAFTHYTHAVNSVRTDPDFALEQFLAFESQFVRVQHYLEGKSGLKAADFVHSPMFQNH